MSIPNKPQDVIQFACLLHQAPIYGQVSSRDYLYMEKVGTPINLESSVFHLGISDFYNSSAPADSVSMVLTVGASVRTTSVISHTLEGGQLCCLSPPVLVLIKSIPSPHTHTPFLPGALKSSLKCI